MLTITPGTFGPRYEVSLEKNFQVPRHATLPLMIEDYDKKPSLNIPATGELTATGVRELAEALLMMADILDGKLVIENSAK